MIIFNIIEVGNNFVVKVYTSSHVKCVLFGCSESDLRLWMADITAKVVMQKSHQSPQVSAVGILLSTHVPGPGLVLMAIMRLSFLWAPSPSGVSSILSSLVVPIPSLFPGEVLTSESLGKTSPVQAEKEKKLYVGLSVSH